MTDVSTLTLLLHAALTLLENVHAVHPLTAEHYAEYDRIETTFVESMLSDIRCFLGANTAPRDVV